jgi:hypothetical protein
MMIFCLHNKLLGLDSLYAHQVLLKPITSNFRSS